MSVSGAALIRPASRSLLRSVPSSSGRSGVL